MLVIIITIIIKITIIIMITTYLYGTFLVQGPLKALLQSKQPSLTVTHTLIRLIDLLNQIIPKITLIIPTIIPINQTAL